MGSISKNKSATATPITIHHADPFHTMQHAFSNVFDNLFNPYLANFSLTKEWENFLLTPSIDVVDEGNHIKIEAEMPGMGPEDIQLSINDESLTIKGEKTTSTKDKEKEYVKREIHYGSYQRTLALPDNVDTSKATASFKKGMLWIVLPKKSGTQHQTHNIKIEEV